MEPLITRLVATSVSIANRAGRIVRDILSKGDLGIVEKVGIVDNQWKSDMWIMNVVAFERRYFNN